MACIQPATQSLGYVFLDYQTNGNLVPRRMRLRLTYPLSPSDLTTIGAEAVLWAGFVGPCLPNSCLIQNWGTMNQDGSVYHVEALPSLVIGTHVSATGWPDFFSNTVTLTGRGQPTTAGQCAGPVRSVLFVGKGYAFVRGQKSVPHGADAAFDALQNFLTGNSVLGADKYGNPGTYRGVYPVQFNAHAQRHLGS